MFRKKIRWPDACFLKVLHDNFCYCSSDMIGFAISTDLNIISEFNIINFINFI